MQRREFVTLLGGAVATWPLASHAQQPERMRRIGVLMILAADDAESSARVAALTQSLQQLGWTADRNVQIEYRWGADSGHARTFAAELAALAPDVILTVGVPALAAVKQVTSTVPVVFVNIVDPVGAGFVESLARPGGNATGFTSFEYGISAKWLELLKQIAPNVTRVGVLRDAAISSGIGQFAVIQGAAPSFGVELRPIDVGDAGEIERAVTTFAHSSNGGLVVTSSPSTAAHRVAIVAVAARYRLPAIYSFRYFATSGGLLSYGPDTTDPFRRAASYMDRILKGEKPADLPVQAPIKYELVINLKTAKSLGLTVPDMLLARADEVIE
jgi:putative tryptophan/tyrosine transport system substrate-binding protein